MRHLFSPESIEALERLSTQSTLCAFDFDGTLAPITGHPDDAGLSETTRQLLARLAVVYPCIVVSGRARADVMEKLAGVPLERVYGNHGAEGPGSDGFDRARVERWKAEMEQAVGAEPAVWVEDKIYSLAVHYRHAPRRTAAKRRILDAAKRLENVRVIGGKQVVNLVRRGAANKGDVVEAERKRLGCAWVMFVGDDDNDEDVFALEGNIISVRVGKK